MDTNNEDSSHTATNNVVLFSRNNQGANQDDVWDDRSLIRAYDRTVNKIKKQLSGKLGTNTDEKVQTKTVKEQQSITTTENEEDDEDDYETEDDTETNVSDENNGEAPPKVFQPSELKRPTSNKSFNVGDLCMAIYSDDGLVYPAKVINVSYDESKQKLKCTVKYLYYLNEEEKYMDELFDYQSDAEPKQSSSESAQQQEIKTQLKPTACEFHTEFNIPPPPLPLSIKSMLSGKSLVSNEEALHSMLMSWYMSGYHTGFYLGLNQATSSKAKTTNSSK
jgi:survival motor neuron protein